MTSFSARRFGSRLLGRHPAGRRATIYPDDVVLVSYPRSGNTWIRFIIGNLRNAEAQTTFSNIESRVPDIYVNSERLLRQIPRPRILKSHEPFDQRYRSVIYIVRDPRDVAISYYRFQMEVRVIPPSYPLRQWVHRFVEGRLDPYGPWDEHVQGWLTQRAGHERFLFLRYEDVLSDPFEATQQIAAFLGLKPSSQEVTRAVESSSAVRMREFEGKERRLWKPLQHARGDSPFVGRAVAGRGRLELPQECIATIESAWAKLMRRLNYLPTERTDETGTIREGRP